MKREKSYVVPEQDKTDRSQEERIKSDAELLKRGAQIKGGQLWLTDEQLEKMKEINNYEDRKKTVEFQKLKTLGPLLWKLKDLLLQNRTQGRWIAPQEKKDEPTIKSLCDSLGYPIPANKKEEKELFKKVSWHLEKVEEFLREPQI